MKSLAFIIIFLFSSYNLATAQSNTDTTDTLQIPGLVTAEYVNVLNHFPVEQKETGRIIRVITREEIQTAPVFSLIELLDLYAGIDVRQRGNVSVQGDISIRGGGYNSPLILLNGTPVNNPQTGHHHLNIPVDMELIERIEILEGPNSRIYGDAGHSGVINIITEPIETGAGIKYGRGSNSLNNTFISAGLLKDQIKVIGQYSTKNSGDYESGNLPIDNTDFGAMNIFLKAEYIDSTLGTFMLQGGYQTKYYGAENFYITGNEDLNEFRDVSNLFANFRYSWGEDLKIVPQAYWRRSFDKINLFRFDPRPDTLFPWYSGPYYHMTDIAGGDIKLIYDSKIGTSALAFEYKNEAIKSTTLGVALDQAVEAPGESDIFYNLGADRDIMNISLNHFTDLKDLAFSVGAAGIYSEDYDWNFTSGFDVVYNVWRNARVFGSVNQGFRLPTFNEMYSAENYKMGRLDLDPAKSLSLEAGLKGINDDIIWHASIFRQINTDQIDWVSDSDSSFLYEAENINDVVFNGISAGVTFNIRSLMNSPRFFIRSLRLDYQWLDLAEYSDNEVPEFTFNYLKNKVVVALDHGLYLAGFGASWYLTWHDREGSYFDSKPSVRALVEHEPVLTLSAKAYYDTPNLKAYFEVANITNARYFDVDGVPLPGVWLRYGFQYRYAINL